MSTATTAPEAAEATKSMGQTYYEEVEALKVSGVTNAEAVRQVAETHGKPVGSIRGGIHQYKARWIAGGTAPTGNGNNSRRRQAVSVDDLVGQARGAVESALLMIDREVEEARVQQEAAKQHYEQIQASVAERKADLEKKLKALA
jgi:hypothetical protein